MTDYNRNPGQEGIEAAKREAAPTKTTITAYEIENRAATIIAHSGGNFFLKIDERWGSRVTEYNKEEMMDEYGLSALTLQNIADQLK